MEWQIILTMAVGIPVILIPAAFVWYLNASGLYQVMQDARSRRARAALRAKGKAVTQ
jgi:hypothetical protein